MGDTTEAQGNGTSLFLSLSHTLSSPFLLFPLIILSKVYEVQTNSLLSLCSYSLVWESAETAGNGLVVRLPQLLIHMYTHT